MTFNVLIRCCAAILLVLTACACGCTVPDGRDPVYAPTPEGTPTPPHVMELSGTTWHLISYRNGTGAGQPVLEGTDITAVFNDSPGEVSGNAGCNHYTARYTVDGSSLRVTELAWTEIYCLDPPGVMRQEIEFLTALERAAAYSFAAQQLYVKDDEGEVLLIFEAGEAPGGQPDLNGTAWHLVSLATAPGEIRPVLEGTSITAVFGDDGTLEGSAGCNRYATDFTQEGNAIRTGHVATTLMYCAGPAGVMEQESAFLAALACAATAEIDGGRLVLKNAAGEPVLIFEEGA